MVETFKVGKAFFVKVAVIVVIIFAAGIFIGFVLDSFRTSFLNEEIILTNVEAESFITSQMLLANNPDYCRLTEYYIIQLSKNVEQLGNDLITFGDKMVFINSSFMDRKYFIYEIRSWIMVEEYKKLCNKSIDTVLFFYTNSGDASRDDASYMQGLALTAMKKELENNLMIFSFKYDFFEPSLELIEKIYNVTKAPSLVINGKLYEGLIKKDELESILAQ